MSKLLIKACVSFCVPLLAATVHSYTNGDLPVPEKLNIREYTAFDGLPQAQSLALAQDSDGYIWTGSYAGVSRYNGHRFETFSTRNGLPNNTIRSVVVGHDGQIVLGTGHGLCFWKTQSIECISQGANLVSSSVFKVIKGFDKSYWIGTESGITHLNTENATHYTVANGLANDAVRELNLDPAGRLWVGTRGLFRLQGEQFIPIASDILGEIQVRAIQHTSNGTYIGTASGLYLIQEDHVVPIANLPRELNTLAILDLFLDSQNNLWIGHYAGVHRLVKDRFERMTPQPALYATATYNIMEDREKNIWFATDEGVSKLVPGAFVGYTKDQGLSHPFVRAMSTDEQHNIWMGTRDGISVYDFKQKRIFDKRKEYPLENSRVYSVLALPNNELLVGTQEKLHWFKANGTRKTYSTAEKLQSNYVSALLKAKDGRIWIGNSRGLAYFEKDQIVPVEQTAVSIAGIYTIIEDSQQRLWLGTGNLGILIYDPKTQKWLRNENSRELSNDTVWSMSRDRQNHIWIGTNAYGLLQVDENLNILNKIDADNGLNDDAGWQVLADHAGTIWTYTNKSLVRINNGDISYYDGRDGLIDLEGAASAILQDQNGDIWFGTGRGVMRYIPEQNEKKHLPPPIKIEGVYEKDTPVIEGTSLSHGFQNIIFRFASLSFKNERDLRYRYRLIGLSDEWSAPQIDPNVTFTALPHGKYQFEVIASDSRGISSTEPAQFKFEVQAPYWATYWFMLLVLSGFAALLYFIYIWRIAKHSKERLRLELIVEERTMQLRASNAELNRLALTDHLTQLYNRRHLMEVLTQETKRLTRSAGPDCLSFILLDIDHFKLINDTYGHTAGDEVLIELSRRLYECVRSTDVVARFGGEEFAIVLPMTDETGATIFAEKVRLAMCNESMLSSSNSRISFSISLGIATACQKSDNIMCVDPEGLIKNADFALYQAKSEGRNCWRVFTKT